MNLIIKIYCFIIIEFHDVGEEDKDITLHKKKKYSHVRHCSMLFEMYAITLNIGKINDSMKILN